MLRADPRPERPTASARPRRRPRRRMWAWPVLALGVALLVLGVVVGDGLLLAAGLVLVGVAGHLFDGSPRRARSR